MSSEKESYFILMCDEDGITFKELSPETLKRRIQPYNGDDDSEAYYYGADEFLKYIPDTDGFCFQMGSNQAVIIKGRIVQPKAISHVTRYELE